ncbi:MAG: cytidylyltransferase domain-containing protein [Gaiellaceae bacterium]
MNVSAIVQARMGSSRFPGKVLAPFRGEPIILHVVRAASDAVGRENVVVATSEEASDDPLAAYLGAIDVPCFRGPSDDVLKRFRMCARAYPSTWVLRLCADSPLLDPAVIRAVIAEAADGVDVVTTTFAGGHGTNAELVLSAALLGIDPAEATDEEREHVMPFFYRRSDRYRIIPVDVPVAGEGLAVDTVEDLARLEARR